MNTFCRLAATRANTLPRPSRYSIVTATDSKRSSADSDSLLCHVGLWRTSRVRFGCASVCEHSEIGFILIVPLSHSHYPRPPCTYSGRAGNACTNLLGFLVRYVRTRGSMRLRGAAKPPIFTLSFAAHTCHALLPAINSCTPRWFGRRTARVLLADFWYFSSLKSTIEEKLFFNKNILKNFPVFITENNINNINNEI